MPEIVIDVDFLHKKSEPCVNEEHEQIIKDLNKVIPQTALGLAAPQIGTLKQVCIINSSQGRLAFVNPNIIKVSAEKIPSTEGCLSLPGITKCVSRHSFVVIEADKIFTVKLDGLQPLEKNIRLKDLDARIIQHEIDHLNGILITDLSEVPTNQEKYSAEQEKKNQKKLYKKQQEKFSKVISNDMNKVDMSKVNETKYKNAQDRKINKKKLKKKEKLENKKIETQERYLFTQQELLVSKIPQENNLIESMQN